jgi:anthranilate synthase component 2
MILLIDNYDSFSYNLYQAIGSFNPDIKVVRNDELTVQEIKELSPTHLVISPGPGKPSDSGVCIEAIKQLYSCIPIFGICLGHQAIFEAFGGTVSYAKKLMHGKSSQVTVDLENALFKGLPPVIQAARYHSLAGLESTLPDPLNVIARTDDGEIMAVCHKDFPVYGVQFHPESILTPNGKIIVENFICLRT